MYERSFELLPKVDAKHQIHLNRYFKLIESRHIRKYKAKSDLYHHHVWPVAFGAQEKYTKEPWNIINLTSREHFIAHLILFYCYGGKMAEAFHLMTQKKSTSYNINNKLTSRQYKILQKECSEARSKRMSGENHPLFGGHPSEESKKKNSETHKIMYSKEGYTHPGTGIPRTKEVKQKIKIKNTGRKPSKETKQKWSDQRKGENNPNYGKSPSEETRIKARNTNPNKKGIINLDTKESFDSIRQAEFYYNISHGNILICCKNPLTTTAKGFHFMFLKEYDSTKIYKYPRNKHSIKIVDINTMEIFDSITDASIKCNISIQSISQCCNHKNKTAGGKYFCFLEEYDKYKDYTLILNEKKVINTDTMEIFDSMEEACKRYILDNGNLTKTCKEINKTCGGFHWMYYEEYLKLDLDNNK